MIYEKWSKDPGAYLGDGEWSSYVGDWGWGVGPFLKHL